MEVPVHRLSLEALKDRLRAAGLSDEVRPTLPACLQHEEEEREGAD